MVLIGGGLWWPRGPLRRQSAEKGEKKKKKTGKKKKKGRKKREKRGKKEGKKQKKTEKKKDYVSWGWNLGLKLGCTASEAHRERSFSM